MATAENARLNVEAGQNFVPMEEMTDSGDQTIYNIAGGEQQLSAADDTSITVRLDGLTTGGVPAPTSNDDEISVSAGTFNLSGVAETASADSGLTIPRPTTLTHQIISVVTTTGGVYSVEEGDEGNSFVETRGAAGGPPSIGVGDIEICQVRLTAQASAPIETSEIFQVNGQHVERSTSPLYTLSNSTGDLTFISPLPVIHAATPLVPATDPRTVWIEYFTPIFSEIADASDFVPPETSDSATSTQVYGRTVSAVSSTLNQGTFSALLSDGISDLVIQQKGQTLWFQFFPNRFSTSNVILSQGKLGVTRSFPADDLISAACTVTAEEEATEESA